MLGNLKKARQNNKRIIQLSTLNGFVFQQEGIDAPMHPHSPTRYLRKFEEKYKTKHFNPHKLRHTFASVAITEGIDPVNVSATLGHADPAITLRMYAHANEEGRRRAGSIIQQAIEATKQG